MKKDVIYIDVEDDLTSIIEKIKVSKSSIVALVPPRRLGVLQSVVNLKLLKRAAEEAGKKAVLITSDQSLAALTAGIGLPVARNLQSRPELVEEDAFDDDITDVIEGTMPAAATDSEPTPAVSETSKVSKAPKTSKKFKVPNFDSFRKRLFLIGGGAVLLIGFLVWAVQYAPHATIAIQAQTEKVNSKFTTTIDSELAGTNLNERALKGALRESTANLTQTFAPTGRKDIGEKASGNITIRNCDFSDGFTLQAGSQFTSSTGQVFVSTQSVTVPKFSGSASSCTTGGSSSGKATVAVQAADIGESYNVPAGNFAIPGVNGKVDAQGTAMSGGSKRTVNVVTQEDVNKAKDQALAKDSSSAKDALMAEFGDNARGLADTFTASQGSLQVQPGVDQEVSGDATLTIPMTYSVLGVANDDLSGLLSKMLEGYVTDSTSQRIYDNGYQKVQITVDQKASAKKITATMQADGHVGPNIDTAQLAQQIAGKRHGEIESIVRPIPGVKNVTSDFSPFWVRKAPSAQKITIKFEVANQE